MGSGASSSKYLANEFDHDNARELAGEHWDELKWEKLAGEQGRISRTQFEEAACEIGLQFPSGPTADGAAVVIQQHMRGKISRDKMKSAFATVRATKRMQWYENIGVSDKELSIIKKCFERYDVHNKNWITPQQLQNAIVDMDDHSTGDGRLDPQGDEFSALFQSIDSNGNLFIEQGEFMVCSLFLFCVMCCFC
jgi:hypothetical protein